MKKTILENEKFIWYTNQETDLARAYANTRGLKNVFVSLVEDKADGRLEYVVLKANESGQTEPIFASSAIGEIMLHLEAMEL